MTIIGIAIGIAAIVSLVSLGQGLENAVNEQFEKMGTDKIIIQSGGFGPPGTGLTRLINDDLEAIEKINRVEAAAGMLMENLKVGYNDKTSILMVHGIPIDSSRRLIEEMETLELENGRELSSENQVLVGYNLANKDSIFGRKVKLRDKITIENEEFQVVGIIKKKGNPIDDITLYAPIKDIHNLINDNEKLGIIIVKTRTDPSLVVDDVERVLRRKRNVKEGQEDFQVQTFEEIRGSFSNILSIVQYFIIGIAAISLVVGGIGIMNTMYMSVLERTKDIGIMKAVGARDNDVIKIFLLESGLLGLAGGLVGLGFGVLIAKGTEWILIKNGIILFKVMIQPTLIVGVLIFSFLIGSLSGTLPALRAAKLKPVEALRYE